MYNDPMHRTDTLNPYKDFIGGEQIKHWIEFQLLDEQGEPLANLPYRAVNEATRERFVLEFVGRTDAEGVIRIEGLHPLPITLLMEADPLAVQLQTRRLRAERAEPPRPDIGDRTPIHGPQRSGFSPIETQALNAGYCYHYLRIGQLCDQLPIIKPPLDDSTQLPAFHFPERKFSGFTVSDAELDRRHVLEICPFRAWSLLLHHQPEYSLVNAYNLGLMSILSYSNRDEHELGSVNQFFEQQCLDLSRTPRVWDNGQVWPCVVVDVPFGDRYTTVKALDTAKEKPPEGHTQLFYAISASQVLVAWRGTEMEGLADLITDATFRPVKSEVAAVCEPKVPCPDLTAVGSVHLGFRDAFEVARRVYTQHLGQTIFKGIDGKKLFICGHSLGGALGLIHAASLKDHNPLLYTYGMPRTFTLHAVQFLGDLRHFRHVNDMDAIPRVPPEAALDNYLYDIYGPMGLLAGFSWSLRQAVTSALFKHEDPYSHHGEIALFLRTEQHQQQEFTPYPAYRRPDGSPYRSTLTYELPIKAKLYLVPSLSEDSDQQAEQATQRLNTSLTAESRARFFPRYSLPTTWRMPRIGDHYMSQYQPYIHNQLLESIDAERDPLLERQIERHKFEQQIKDYYGSIHADELARSRIFLDLQALVDQALHVTQQMEGGAEALQRFNAIADPKAYYEKIYG
ncbi:lipase family protein [Pseudomonas fluorescens]|uniref:lipase family protein n=1 Tax=Pseudomonas fluorescens TaxID=294 RepID=UPI00177E8BE7|nr:lipase family protein [Pseudomonas fluorescens]MBD8194641.1 lipase family protein [Pseudomonas fluorescens]MBD8229537.1 lipase family protein [Pseudomonas fluorescens]MBD8819816.1 lipase family protein [Pseudomonas fluorescens]